jgi:PAS domain S-box-containing protein
MIFTGVEVARRSGVRGRLPHIVGGLLVVWGLHRWDYPLLRPVEAFAPWGFGAAAVLEQLAALGLVLLHLRSARDAQHRSEALYRSLVDEAPIGIVRTTRGGRILNANPALVEMLGCASEDEVRALRLPDDVYARPEERERVLAAAPQDAAELELRRRDGSTFRALVHVQRLEDPGTAETFYLGVVQDVTERRRLEARVRSAQRMEAIGRLAGGVAHDFNNLLTVVSSATSLLRAKTLGEADRRELLEDVIAASERGAQITRQLLSISRAEPAEPTTVDLAHVVESSRRLLQRLVGERIEVRTELRDAPCWVRADPGQLQQVLLNFAANARDAMPDGGTLGITVDRSPPSEGARQAGLPAEGCVHLAVRDEGPGMDEETRARAFEPFFTRKGEGTGLGLATVYGAVVQSGGFVELDSQLGVGTVFDVYFPPAEPPRAEPQGRAAPDPSREAGTVLVAEDEPVVRRMVTQVLSREGFEVLGAGDGTTALELACERPVDLVLADVIMPGLTGPALAERLQRTRPEVAVLFMSGYPEAELARSGATSQGRVLRKPFSAAELRAAVEDALRARPAAQRRAPGA